MFTYSLCPRRAALKLSNEYERISDYCLSQQNLDLIIERLRMLDFREFGIQPTISYNPNEGHREIIYLSSRANHRSKYSDWSTLIGSTGKNWSCVKPINNITNFMRDSFFSVNGIIKTLPKENHWKKHKMFKMTLEREERFYNIIILSPNYI